MTDQNVFFVGLTFDRAHELISDLYECDLDWWAEFILDLMAYDIQDHPSFEASRGCLSCKHYKKCNIYAVCEGWEADYDA